MGNQMMKWMNEPTSWREEQYGVITVTTDADTDFWRITHYDFIRDSGHAYLQETSGDFVAGVKIEGEYQALYDQAGLMLRIDDRHWLKCGIEYVNGVQQASAVVTREYSDWSVTPLPQNPSEVWLRLQRIKEAVEIFYSLDGQQFHLLRMAYLPPVEQVQVGIMCASPQGKGFTTRFTGFALTQTSSCCQ